MAFYSLSVWGIRSEHQDQAPITMKRLRIGYTIYHETAFFLDFTRNGILPWAVLQAGDGFGVSKARIMIRNGAFLPVTHDIYLYFSVMVDAYTTSSSIATI